MMRPPIAEIKARADLRDVWGALGGGELRRCRGQAFWRAGDGYSVSLDFARGVWYDHRDGAGGDVVELVRTARGCSFVEAVEWLATHCGIPVSNFGYRDQNSAAVDTDWRSDLERATYFALAAEALAETALEELPFWHAERRGLTVFLRAIRLGDGSLVEEYREFRRSDPALTAGMVRAGRLSDARKQRKAMAWLGRYLDAKTA